MSKTFSNSIVLTRVADGKSASSLFVETEYDEVLRFDTESGVTFSPEIFEFKVKDQDNNTYLKDFSWTCGYQNGNHAYVILGSSYSGQGRYNDCFSFTKPIGGTDGTQVISDTDSKETLYFDVVKLYNSLSEEEVFLKSQIDNGQAVFKFVYAPTNKQNEKAIKYFQFVNGVSADMAKLHVGANAISMAIRDSSLQFSADGLTMWKGDFSIINPSFEQVSISSQKQFEYYSKPTKIYQFVNDEYVETNQFIASTLDNPVVYYVYDYSEQEYSEIQIESEKQFNDYSNNNKIYTVKDNGNYGLIRTYVEDENTGYFLYRDSERVFYADEEGNLNLIGNVYANNGSFTGVVNAISGSFSGRIDALYGKIGGFEIGDYYEPTSYDKDKEVYIRTSLKPLTYSQIGSEDGTDSVYFINAFGTKQEYNGTLYLETPDTKKISGKDYYIFEDGEYKVGSSTDFISGTTYYEKIENDYYLYKGKRLKSEQGSIILDGTNGEIFADNITLGQNVRLQNSILFKNEDGSLAAAIYNPTTNDNKKFFEASKVFLTSEGKLRLGDMELYGGTGNFDGYLKHSHIDANQQGTEGYWEINENGTARFKNITTNDLKVQNAVFETQSVQSIGSIMIFKDSWKVEDKTRFKIRFYGTEFEQGKTYYEKTGDQYEETSDETLDSSKEYYQEVEGYKLDKRADISNNQYIAVDDVYYQIYAVNDYDDTEHTYISIFDDQQKINIGSTITKMGSDYQDEEDCVISISGSGKSAFYGPAEFASPHSFTISSFERDNTNNTKVDLNFTKRLILGKLDDAGIDDLVPLGGYGLYADNVYLNGSLTTRQLGVGDQPEKWYSGIGTKSTAGFEHEEVDDTSPIIFWGGATGISDDLIKKAPFQVTQQGTVYAKSAILDDSVFVGGTLKAAKMETVEIHGKDGGALSIFDTKAGIIFKEQDDEATETTGTEVFSIGTSGLIANDKNFITISKNSPVTFLGEFESEKTDNDRVYKTKMVGDSVNFYLNDTNFGSIQSFRNTLNGNDDRLLFKINDKSQIILGHDKTLLNSINTYIDKNLFLGSRNDGLYEMEMRQASGGFDVFIY